VQYYNGTTWYTVASYATPANFSNNIFYMANVSILESSYTFPTAMKIRFMCDASDNNDDVYVDNVRITASTVANPNNYITPLTKPQEAEEGIGEAGNQVSIYPNPAYNDLNIRIENNKLAEIFIYDMQGRVVHHEIMSDVDHVIDIEQYRTGVYLVYIITRDETFKSKFIKK
jgi:hypothetical protein